MPAAQSGDREAGRVRKLFDWRHSGFSRNAALRDVDSMPQTIVPELTILSKPNRWLIG